MSTNNTKGQVTVFIIIGLLILFTVAAIVYVQYRFKPAFELSQDPLTAYVQQCLIDTTKEAVVLAGQTGGYLYQDTITKQEKDILKLAPFNSDMLLVGNQQLPYWYYQQNDGIDRIAIPELEKQAEDDNSIQSQIELYVEEKMPVCLNNFKALVGMNIKQIGNLTISTTFTADTIEMTAEYPLEVQVGETVTAQNSFSAVLTSSLKRTYSLAREIAEQELNTLFLEQTTKNLLSSYGQVDENYLPPMSGGLYFETCADRVFWFYPDVKSDVQQMLAANIPYVHVAGTDFGQVIIDSKKESNDDTRELRQSIFDSFIIKPENSYSDLIATFNYQTNYPFELMFGKNVGYGLMQPDAFEMNLVIANICMFEYSFLYNLKYPVVVSVIDPENPIDGSAYVFQFPLQVVLKNNYPRIKLNDILRTQYVIPEASAEPSYQCSPQQRLSAESAITVNDPKGGPVENAVVTFQCGPSYVYEYDVNGTLATVHQFAETCFMGTTDSNGEFSSAYPPCIGGGIVTIKHPDYLEKSVATGDIVQGQSFEKQVILDKIYTRKLNIQKYFVAPPAETNEEGIGVHMDENGNIIACNINLDAKEFQPYETAIVTLTKLDIENGLLNSMPIVVYNGTESEIDIAAGEYYVDIMLLRAERYAGEMTIEANSEAISVQSTFSTETITYPEEDILVPQTFSGGAVFLWNVTAAELESGDALEFSIFDEGAPKTIEQVSAPLMHREACSALQYELIKPVVK